MRITVDGVSRQAEEGQTILEATRACGIDVPALCDHPTFGHYGGCRLCCVEVIRDSIVDHDTGAHLVSSCTTRVADGMIIRTRSPRIDKARRTTLTLLAKRLHGSSALDGLIAEYGVDERLAQLELPADTDSPAIQGCLLCGLCVRACDRIGKHALIMEGRGTARHISKPTFQGVTPCIDCGLCRNVCPTGAICALTCSSI